MPIVNDAALQKVIEKIDLMETLESHRLNHIVNLNRKINVLEDANLKRDIKDEEDKEKAMYRARIDSMIKHANFHYMSSISCHANGLGIQLTGPVLVRFGMEAAVHVCGRYAYRSARIQIMTALKEWSWEYLAQSNRSVFDDAALFQIRNATRQSINALPPLNV